nr:immunoglobulin heavy chain junction region [Macaca mulatta]MOV52948.1 immunoglobulin heavy chain junction region [Macaca mulatta]
CSRQDDNWSWDW